MSHDKFYEHLSEAIVADMLCQFGLIKCWNDGCEEGQLAKQFTEELFKKIETALRLEVQSHPLTKTDKITPLGAAGPACRNCARPLYYSQWHKAKYCQNKKCDFYEHLVA